MAEQSREGLRILIVANPLHAGYPIFVFNLAICHRRLRPHIVTEETAPRSGAWNPDDAKTVFVVSIAFGGITERPGGWISAKKIIYLSSDPAVMA
ncbi:hypothetical protein [Roseovarius sp. E0-M6]|uniref:hypothetical protein n=1 Tax=Roseovarius sp. E0-M6 TaxID=3127118 RepID=UPI00300F8347